MEPLINQDANPTSSTLWDASDFIVLTGGTTVANGAYNWSVTSPIAYNPSGGWGAGGVYKSSDGTTWLYNSGDPEFAITASAIPEPGILGLLGFGGLLFALCRCFGGGHTETFNSSTLN